MDVCLSANQVILYIGWKVDVVFAVDSALTHACHKAFRENRYRRAWKVGFPIQRIAWKMNTCAHRMVMLL